jgi:UDP-N-acetyl-D-glucosamine/UDP-N-acetyl-D-galactosamine dehydrogenase
MYEQLIKKEKKVSVTGLGYVGLPLALAFARKIPVIGFDIKPDRIELMNRKIDPSRELDPSDFEGCDIRFTADPEDLREAGFHIIAVPTPIDEHNLPDLNPILSASKTVGKILKKGDYVIYESTVYPGCTEEDCVPLLEEHSGLKFMTDFKVGFSPERINPGDKEHTLEKIVKVVAGCDEESLDNISKTYELIIGAGVHRAGSIKVAEAAKIIENTQRDLNIAFMNELSMIFNRMNINTHEVLEAAGTKWNFLRFYPGLVGGHCIGVDPYYLTYKAREFGYHAQIINAGRYINDSMGRYVARQTVKRIISLDKNIRGARILIMGITFKENVSDIRNSKVADVYHELRSYGISDIDLVDPHASPEETRKEYGIDISEKIGNNYDAIIVAVNHKEYLGLSVDDFIAMSRGTLILIDVKSTYRKSFSGRHEDICYWSL